MVLRSQSVGEQDVADQQGAFCAQGGRARPRPGPPALFAVKSEFAIRLLGAMAVDCPRPRDSDRA